MIAAASAVAVDVVDHGVFIELGVYLFQERYRARVREKKAANREGGAARNAGSARYCQASAFTRFSFNPTFESLSNRIRLGSVEAHRVLSNHVAQRWVRKWRIKLETK